MSVSVFTYGTLMCADIMQAAAGGLPPSTPARVQGFSRHPVAGEDYPGIRRSTTAHVEGLLYHDVAPPLLKRLDTFEGSQYRRETVTVTLADGHRITAQTYVFADNLLHLLEPGEWDYPAFLNLARHRFAQRHIGF